jgi:hypothetical protein
MAQNHRELLTILAAEYQALKAEQTARIVLRENALGANFVVVGAILTIAAALHHERIFILLLIPFAAATTYWVYLNNDIAVSTLQRFFQNEFPKQVAIALGLDPADEQVSIVLGRWESYHRANTRNRALRKVGNTAFVLIGAAGTSVGALIATATAVWSTNSYSEWSLWVAAAVVTCGLVTALVRTSDVGWQRRRRGLSRIPGGADASSDYGT